MDQREDIQKVALGLAVAALLLCFVAFYGMSRKTQGLNLEVRTLQSVHNIVNEADDWTYELEKRAAFLENLPDYTMRMSADQRLRLMSRELTALSRDLGADCDQEKLNQASALLRDLAGDLREQR